MRIGAWNVKCVINTWIVDSFMKTHLWRNRESCGHKEDHTHPFLGMQVDCEPAAIPMNATAQVSLPWAPPAWQSGCMAMISPLAVKPLKFAPWSRETFLLTTDVWMSPVWFLCKYQLDCMPVALPLSWGTSQGLIPYLRLRDSSSPKVKRPLIHNRSSSTLLRPC